MRIPSKPNPASGSGARPGAAQSAFDSRPGDGTIASIGDPIWDRAGLAAGLKPFLEIYARRPIPQNDGGMKSNGLFALWAILKKINPRLVVESGVWKGQSTWLIENALPEAAIFAIDPASDGIVYRSARADYTTRDFTLIDWSAMAGFAADTLVFFDDHQDVFERLRICRERGFKTVLLDDNYPEYTGNRHISLAAILNQRFEDGSFRFPREREILLDGIASYHPFPPIFDYREPVTMEKSPITVPSLLGTFDPVRHGGLEPYWQDASSYRWTSLVRLK